MRVGNAAPNGASAIRHWRFCFNRAQEIGASLPDGTLLLKGLETAPTPIHKATSVVFKVHCKEEKI